MDGQKVFAAAIAQSISGKEVSLKDVGPPEPAPHSSIVHVRHRAITSGLQRLGANRRRTLHSPDCPFAPTLKRQPEKNLKNR
jgi:hypothetical protein